jgi:hypothetical protein
MFAVIQEYKNINNSIIPAISEIILPIPMLARPNLIAESDIWTVLENAWVSLR